MYWVTIKCIEYEIILNKLLPYNRCLQVCQSTAHIKKRLQPSK